MNIRATILLCVLALVATSSSVFAQTTPDSTYPYTGIVTGTRVYVRCGPGDNTGHNNFYFCTRLDRPEKVTVVGERNGWLRIVPPKGCYSVISQRYVKLDETGTKGTVTGSNVWVRPAGTLRNSNFHYGQIKLQRGTAVNVLGKLSDSNGQWYKIESPKGTYYWIWGKLVERVKDETPEAPEPADTVTPEQPGDKEPAAPSGAPKEDEKLAKSIDPEDLKAFRNAEKALIKEYEKPFKQRNFEALIQNFENVKLSEGSPLKPYVDYYILYVKQDMKRRQEMAAVEMLSRSSAERQKLYDLSRAQTQIKEVKREITYTVEGVLEISRLFSGGTSHIQRYLIFHPSSRKLNAYVEAAPGVNLKPYLGKHVGIYGQSRFDKQMGVRIVTARQIMVIDPAAKLPALPEPTVKPMPKLPPRKPVTTDKKPKPSPATKVKPEEKPAEVKPKPAATKGPPVVKPVAAPTAPAAAEPTKPSAPILLQPSKPAPVVKPKTLAAPEPAPKATPPAEELTPITVTPEPSTSDITKPITAPKPVIKSADVPKQTPRPAEVVKPQPLPEVGPRPEPKVIKTPALKPETVEVKPAAELPKPVEAPKPRIVAPKPTAKAPKPVIPSEAPRPIAEETPLPTIEPTPVVKPVETPVTTVKPRQLTKPKTGEGEIEAPRAPVAIPAAKPGQTDVPPTILPGRTIKPEIKPVITPKPITVTKPKLSKPTPKVPTTQPASKPKTKPARSIEPVIRPLPLEEIGPAVKPAKSVPVIPLDIPAPTTKPKEEKKEFPKPLPPKGLPLIQPATTPTTMPVDEEQYQ